MERRAVVTGLGLVSGYGLGIGALIDGLASGRSAIAPITVFRPDGFPTRLGAAATSMSAKDHVPKSYRKATKIMARDTEIAVTAAELAVRDAGLVTREHEGQTPTYPSARTGCSIGAGLIAAETTELTVALASSVDGARFSLGRWGNVGGETSGMSNLQPLWMLKYLPNMLACHVTIIHGAEGPSNTITCGEASGLLSIGESTRVIQRGDADACFCGGAESKLNPLGMAKMTLMGRLAPADENSDPLMVVRPYARESLGTLIGEGGGILIAESEDTARARGARIYAEIAGFGASQTVRSRDGVTLGLADAISSALEDARLRADEVSAIVAGASGVPREDEAEIASLRAVFGDRLSQIPIIALTPMLGDASAGRGGLQACVAAWMASNSTEPARSCEGDAGLRLSARAASTLPMGGAILACSGSIGGQNSAVIFRPLA